MRARPEHDPAAELRAALHGKALELVRLSLEMTAAAGSGHPTSAASLAHLVTVLLYRHMRWDPAVPDDPAADRLVLSEGHACPIVYAAAADLGVALEDPRTGRRRPMTREDALRLRSVESPIDGHPNPAEGFPFFPAATGSLGQGLSVACGLALAQRLDGHDARVFCLIGDGESREGQVWEALDFLVDQRLRTVCPIFNANGEGQTGPVSPQQSPANLARKLAAFGLEPVVLDGHDPDEVLAALERHANAAARNGPPVALVARTIKGFGTPSLAGQVAGRHGKEVVGEELRRALGELAETWRRLEATTGTPLAPPSPAAGSSRRPRVAPRAELPSLAEALQHMEDEKLQGALAEGSLATREAYGAALWVLGGASPDVVVLDGDVSGSTYAASFARDEALRARFFECRIAEQNMLSCAAGLAAGGKLPFVSTFGKFHTRAYDQIEMALVGEAPLRIVGSHVGVSLAADGPSQMALPDAAWFASLGRTRRRDGSPLVHVLTPCDAWSAFALTLEMAYSDGATYLRTLRPRTPLVYGPEDEFRIGGHRVVAEGLDLAILAWGYMVHEALRAAELLRSEGLEATVVDLYSLPFDADAIVDLVRENRGRALTVEDNYGGGLGAAVAEALALAPGGGLSLRQMFVRRVPKSGRSPDDVLEHVGLSRTAIVEAARQAAG